MSQNVERYMSFTVALLKDSVALEALWQDALKYHMIDQPGKLIAMRLTEYYEFLATGVLPGIANTPIPAPPQIASSNADSKEEVVATAQYIPNNNNTNSNSFGNSHTNNGHNSHAGNHFTDTDMPIMATSPDVAQNAEAAADYWTLL